MSTARFLEILFLALNTTQENVFGFEQDWEGVILAGIHKCVLCRI
jgi:hypothetical protein